MKVLVLGATGMLGHVVARTLALTCDVVGTVRGPAGLYAQLQSCRLLEGVDAARPASIEAAVAAARPTVVVNCIAAVKQDAAGQDPATAIRINSLFPHELMRICRSHDSRLIHISTDGVFSGGRGRYRESDTPDATDLYGLSKRMGEVEGPSCITLRTAVIGRELRGDRSLVEWFLSQRGGTVKGYARAIFSGVTTHEMARVIADLCRPDCRLTGLWHVAAEPIDKYSLLQRLDAVFGSNTRIERDTAFVCDRSLDGSAFAQKTGYRAPSWDAMIGELAEASATYED